MSDYTRELAQKLEKKYETPVLPTDCSRLNLDDINNIFGKILYEFPINEIDIELPKWIETLDEEHPLNKEIFEMVKTNFRNMQNLRQIKNLINEMPKSENIEKIDINEIKLGDGIANLDICVKKELFYQILSEMSGIEVKEEQDIQIDIDVSSYIPDSFIDNNSQKIEIYQNIALCRTEEDIQNVIDEIIDRYGHMPSELENLIEIGCSFCVCICYRR